MRAFWTVILLLAFLTAGLFGVAAFRQHRAARDELARANAAAAEAKALALAASIEASKKQQQAATPAPAAPGSPASPSAALPQTPPSPSVHVQKPATITPSPGSAPPTTKAKTLPALLPPTLAPAKIGEYDVMGAALVQRTEEGLAFGDILIKGEGTQDNPYIVPWDALVSAEDVFDPTNHSLRIPEVVAMVHDKFVRLDGYVSFPLMTNQPKELLAMLNMWDGCCIGVPPTPYDAVEVQLKQAVTGDARYAVSGRVTGKFTVKPYVVKNWLVGLYVMEQAEFTPSEDGEGT